MDWTQAQIWKNQTSKISECRIVYQTQTTNLLKPSKNPKLWIQHYSTITMKKYLHEPLIWKISRNVEENKLHFFGILEHCAMAYADVGAPKAIWNKSFIALLSIHILLVKL